MPPSRDSWFGKFTFLLNAIGTLWILAMVVAVNTDVLGRSLFNRPLPGVAEFVGLSIVAIVWIQGANTLRVGRFIRSDVWLNRIERWSPRWGQALHALFNLTGLALGGIIFYFSVPLLVQSYEEGFYRGTFGVVTIPVWPVKVIILVGCAALTVQFLLMLAGNLRRLLGRDHESQ